MQKSIEHNTFTSSNSNGNLTEQINSLNKEIVELQSENDNLESRNDSLSDSVVELKAREHVDLFDM